MNKYAIGDLIQIFSIKLLGFSILTNSLLLIISTFSERNFTGSLLEDFNCSWICFGIFFSKMIKFVGIIFSTLGLRVVLEIVKILILYSKYGYKVLLLRFNSLKSIS